MPVQINQQGQWAAEYVGPYSGLNVQQPETQIPDTASPSFNNFQLRNAELRSRPRCIPWSNFNFGNAILGATTFLLSCFRPFVVS